MITFRKARASFTTQRSITSSRLTGEDTRKLVSKKFVRAVQSVKGMR